MTSKFLITATAAVCFLASNIADAQVAGPNVYFDPNVTGGTALTSNTGDFSTSDFWNGTTDAPFADGTNAVGNFVPGDGAIFDGTAGTVEVSSAVTADYLEVGVTSGTLTFGTAGDEASITLPTGNSPSTGPDFSQTQVGPNFLNPVQVDAGSENVVFNSNLNFGIIDHTYNGAYFNSATSGNITFNGGITFTNNTSDNDNVGNPSVVLNSTAGGTFTIDSAVSEVDGGGSAAITNGNYPTLMVQGTSGKIAVLTLTNTATVSNVKIEAGANSIVYDQGATYDLAHDKANGNGLAFAGNGGEYLADTAGMTVQTSVEVISGTGVVGSDLENATVTFSGNANPVAPGTAVSAYGGVPYLTAAAGGRVNFTGDVFQGNGGDVIKIGAGTVSLDDAGTVRAEDQQGGWEIQNGTLLISTTHGLTGSGVTIDNVATSALVAGKQTYATLGGVGSTIAPVTAAGANSSITPGDPTINNGIGTLTLSGGLTAANGLTLNFSFSGATNSELNLGSTAFTPDGVLTFNLTKVDAQDLLLNTPYQLVASGSGTSYAGVTDYVYNAPEGYAATGSFNAQTDVFSVEFTETPEPSTVALMLGGIALLALGLRQKARALIG